MKRCLDLARKGADLAAPNPMVGAVIVYKDRIIGEGFHKEYGKAHAEVNAVASVTESDRKYLEKSTIYVTLEPCCIHGNTPPCTELIFKHKIPNVVVGYIDKYLGDSGKSINILRDAGVNVTASVLEEHNKELSSIRDTYTQKHRPYIILKYAESQNGYIGKKGHQIWLSNPYTKRLVHKWRSEAGAILVGTNTVQIDDPSLDNRLYFSKSPTRVVIDRNLTSKQSLKVWNGKIDTLFVTEKNGKKHENTDFIRLKFDETLLNKILEELYSRKISSLIVEGGAATLQAFINQNLWDEARILKTSKMINEDGIPAPKIAAHPSKRIALTDNELVIYKNAKG